MAALSLPMANAACERDFSKINNIKTKKRNKLITPTVNGCLLASQAVRKGEGCCVKFKPTDAMYAKMTSANVYRTAGKQQRAEDNTTEEVDLASLFTFDDENM
ncbi:Zinc finger protein 862 [Frankliniella fusca]|uniref:Zinc finger protein 862 n=1 Tax=Frankliniella fusca TaxID=407009 RepID=A0AAE1LIK5_9NEOP|nr:Zinc finger protein 862 [Frankliniella fusca]